MKCDQCHKNKKRTFSRLGGEVEVKGKRTVAQPYTICGDCLKKGSKGNPYYATVITNPTIIPSGDPLEWVINDE